ncbi:hypothetical protein E4T48_06167 [Aureobasidium sp. EXF-10727]|nr:hypothetical protein E4T48_06167 [Aureobasidium sp. EXF-10727]
MCSISLLFFALAFTWTLVSAVPYPVLPSFSSFTKAANQPIVDRFETIAVKVPCVDCPVYEDDVALDFELQYPRLDSSTNLCDVDFTLNGRPIVVDRSNQGQTSTLHIPRGLASQHWDVDLAVQGLCDSVEDGSVSTQRALYFNVTKVAQQPLVTPGTFTVVVGHSESAQVFIDSEIDEQADCTSTLKSVINENSSILSKIKAIPADNDIESSADILTVEQVLRNRLLEQATKLQKLNQRCHKDLAESLADCHKDIKCMSKVMCQRIHDTTYQKIKQIQAALQDSIMVSKDRQDQYVAADEKDDWNFNVSSVDNLLSDIKDGNSKKYAHESQHPLVLALEILAAAIGLSALCAFIRRRCGSLRRRVERLSDKEERRRARHFRCLARKEALRKKWVSFKQVFKRSPRNGEYEEKRALVIEAAGIAVDDYAEGCSRQIDDLEMGHAFGDLRNAREFVASLVHLGRARKSSNAGSGTTTLPEYTEEKLPDYTSTPDDYAPSIVSMGSRNTGITPDSSIVMTPRCSRETLRTGTDFSAE